MRTLSEVAADWSVRHHPLYRRRLAVQEAAVGPLRDWAVVICLDDPLEHWDRYPDGAALAAAREEWLMRRDQAVDEWFRSFAEFFPPPRGPRAG